MQIFQDRCKTHLCLRNRAPSGGTDAKCSELCERNACGDRHTAAARSGTTALFRPSGLRLYSFCSNLIPCQNAIVKIKNLN